MAMSAGMMLGPVLAGALAEVIGLRALFLFSGVVGLLGTAAFGWLTIEHPIPSPAAELVVERRTKIS